MFTLNDVGLMLALCPELRSSPDLRRFLDESADALEQVFVKLHAFPLEATGDYEALWEANEWREVCRLRSGVQFFIDLYRDTGFAPFLEGIDTTFFDDWVREWGGRQGYALDDERPRGTPSSHWWWWYPRAPPRE
jgi:hypothetical protein